MDWLRHDLRFALRGLRRRPGVSLLAILTLAVGLGVNTVAFSAVNALVFRPFHVPGADTIGWIFAGPKQDPLREMSIAAFDAVTRASRTLDAVAAEGRVALALDTQGETRQVWALAVTPRYFDLVPAPIATGRGLVASDHRPDAVAAVVSERFWRASMGATADLAAARLVLNRQPVAVVGVVRDGFQGPGGLFEPDIWMPLEARRVLGLPADLERTDRGWLTVIGRPAPGAPADAIAAEIGPIVAAADGRPAGEIGAQYVRVLDGHPEARALQPAAALALGAVAVVLLIACFNVAGLLLARAAERQRDFALAAALGASRLRLVRQLATEGLVLAACAAAAALLLAQWSSALLSTFSLPAPIPQRLHFSTDWRLLAFSGGLALVAALVPTLWPAWRVWRVDLTAGSRGTAANAGGGRAAARSRRAFLVLQAAGATVFLVAAAVCVRGYVAAARADLGFDTAHIALLDIDPAAYGYAPAPARAAVDAVVARLRTRADIAAVSVADHVPFFVGFPLSMEVRTNDAACTPGACPRAMLYVVDGAHVDAMGLTVDAGRMFDDGAADRDSVVLSRAAADTFFPGTYPVGQTFRDGDGRVRTVAGVVRDVTQRAIARMPAPPVIYRPLVDTDFARPVTIVARARGDAAALLAPMRDALRQAAPGLPPAQLQTMTDRLALPLWPVRTLATFFGVCGALAVLLATVGLCGVTHQVVTQRTREFGVRLAIGASSRDVERLVLVESLRLIAPGVVIGLVAAAGLSLVARSQWLGLEPADPRVFAAALAVQVATTLIAAWWPARRAAHTNPLEALRSE